MELVEIEKSVRLTDLEAGREQLYMLEYSHRNLAPCSVKADEEYAHFVFSLEYAKGMSGMEKASRVDKLRTLINIFELEELWNSYIFSLEPDNLFVDINLKPLVLVRDLADEDTDQMLFFERYMALAGCMLNRRYSYDDYLNGGKGLYKKKPLLKRLSEANSSAELCDMLREEYGKEEERQKKTKVLVGKRRNIALRIATPILLVITVLAVGGAGWLYFVALPKQDALLTSHQYFLQENYDEGIDALSGLDISEMPKETLYQLARAYVVSENLNSEQKRNILSGLTLKSDTNHLAYWVEIGRLHYDSAVDLAQRLGDDELLLYALIKHSVAVKNDPYLSGEEKTTRSKELDSQIEALRKTQQGLQDLAAESGTAISEEKSTPVQADETGGTEE